MKNIIRKFTKYVSEGTSILGIFALGSYGIHAISGNDLSHRDFERVEWIESYNGVENIRDFYLNENIAHNGLNWKLYFNKVLERNKGRLENNLILPDLDNDGKVEKDSTKILARR
ncbi:MAG: hypothetical protein Q8P15_00355 [Nanoarchaeota archaeon]|nr:hypothetical protein [Nanoarchaeota archaeon]